MFAIDPQDSLALNDAQLNIIQRAIALEPMPVDERIADRTYEATATNEAGRVRLRNFTDPKISRLTAYRFHRENMLNEHLFHIWPAKGFDFPALTTVIFEMPQVLILGADLLPIADVIFDRTYYGRWMLGYSEVLKKHCAEAGRDPSEIHVSVQTLVAFTDIPGQADRAKGRPAAMIGNTQEIRDMVEQYREAGADETCIADFNLADLKEKKDTCDRFMAEVASHFR